MNKSPYSHEQVPGSPRQYQARHNNVLNILSSLVQKPGERQMAPQIPPQMMNQPMMNQMPEQPMPQRMSPQIEQPAQSGMPEQPPVDTPTPSSVPDDFQVPPIKDYWLQVLEDNVKSDPNKQGPDWRDEAIAKFKQVRARLDQMEAALDRKQAGR